MQVSVKKLLQKARREGYAIGAFNTVNLETTRAILEAAAELSSPVIVQMTEKTLDYGGGRAMYHLVKNIADFYFPGLPIGIHLDHGRNLSVVRRALGIGFKSVMMDASTLSYVENIEETKTIVREAHAVGADVQAELGNVPYIGEIENIDTMDWDQYMTDPSRVAEFIRLTGADTLAVAIGNAHAAFPERTEPDYERLEAIRKATAVPLILHGASDWTADKIQRVIERGITCFNVDTATRTAFLSALRTTLNETKEKDIRRNLQPARDAFKAVVKEKILLFGSSEKI